MRAAAPPGRPPFPRGLRGARRLGLLLALLAAGCVEREEQVTLEADGSGSMRVTASFCPAALAELERRVLSTAGVNDPPERVAGVNPIAPGWLRAQSRGVEGLTLASAEEQRSPDGRITLTAEARFTSLEAAARGGLFGAAEVAFERRPKKRWRLTLREAWSTSGPGADDAFGGIPAAQLKPTFEPDLAALSHRLVLTFPFPVVSTTGELSSDRRTVTYRARGDEAAPRGLEVELELPEDAVWPTFRHRPDLAVLTRHLVVAAPTVAPSVPPPPGDSMPLR